MRWNGILGGVVAVAVLTSPEGTAAQQEVAWLYDYAKARQAAAEKGKPLLINFGAKPSTYCERLDRGTFSDPIIVRLVNSHYIPLKIDATRNPLAEFMRTQIY